MTKKELKFSMKMSLPVPPLLSSAVYYREKAEISTTTQCH